jgi:formylglycine-generating enzyme
MKRLATLCLVAMASACGSSKSRRKEQAPAPALVLRPANTPREVICLPAGTFIQGRNLNGRRDERPRHNVHVNAFCLEPTLVTRKDFARFVEETHHFTDAERRGFGIESVEGMIDWEWRRVPHANWRRPFRDEDADTRNFLRDDVPVVMVSWFDAVAYCSHQHGRLPTEAEWEYAMRAGAEETRFPWGNERTDDAGVHRLNAWEGASHAHNDRHDGYVYVSPVRAFPPNAWGFYDPVGNVWQWAADIYRPDAYSRARENVLENDEDAGTVTPRVLRGGSWWCAACTCEGYGLWYRGHGNPRAALSNNGFRCAYDTPP